MRNHWIAAVLSVLLGLAHPAAAQQPLRADAGPTSRANVILVTTTAQPEVVVAALSEYLKFNGFAVDTLDAARGLVTTHALEEGQTLAEQTKIRAVRGANGWRLTGLYLMGGPLNSGFTAFSAMFLGLDGAPSKVAFRQVEAAARAIPGGSLRYDRAKVRFGAFTKWEDALKMPW
ncbi:hypothetical protein [Hymenobacter glacialis]|uniref:Uncharacterized protein n=1 Tax=Hymenobacter glacialis TaxID=1908236 RepID=A0A1G1T751_9BACT|nr:hypothetical protein [Hymenobacter glacialis]OGX86713.1 hypothetical protein BEN48_12310 [Hymenobacter glacialis]